MNHEVFKLIRNVAEEAGVLSQEGKGDPEVPLSELGMDSLDAVELVMAIEEKLEVDLYDFQMEKDTSLGTITDEVEKQLRAKGEL